MDWRHGKKAESGPPVYLLMDSSSILLARAALQGPADGANMQFRLIEGQAEDVVAAEVIQAIPVSGDYPLQLGRVILRRGKMIVLDPLKRLGSEVRENLRMAVSFESFIYPVEGGRLSIRSHDLSCGGIAFRCEEPLKVGDEFEIVIPITEGGPLIVNARLLRVMGSEDDPLYAAEFVGTIHDQEALIREAVFNVQLERKNQRN